MSLLDYFRKRKADTASVAKERLQIIVAHERKKREEPDYLPQLQKDLMEVIRKYVEVEVDQVEVQLDNNSGCSVLELNVTLPN